MYGADAVYKFLKRNKLLAIIRAHEVQIEGYKMYNWKGKDFPQVITIFSAPNYCDSYNNKAAVIKFENNSLDIQQFHHSPHPYYLPNFMNVFDWSLPFVAEKITEIFYSILKQQFTDEELQEVEIPNMRPKSDSLKKLEDNKGIMKNKLQFMAKMLKMQKILREENENIIKIKSINDNKIP